jgi:hypothetical protein
MRGATLLMAMLIALPAPAMAAIAVEKPVSRIDSLIATEKDGTIIVQAKGAVASGGWKHAKLKPAKSTAPADARVLIFDFVAEPPLPNQAVIPGLLPVAAQITVKSRKGLVSVRAVSASNEVTTQLLR